jgi:phosphoribosyl-dephospho-CoA transferase
MRLQRHSLVRLDEYGWYRVLAPRSPTLAWDAEALDCLEHWAEHDLPLVVTRQWPDWTGSSDDEPLTLGLAAPLRWGRRRLAVQSHLRSVRRVDRFAPAAAIEALLPAAARPDWSVLCSELARLGVDARVYGSHGWEHLSGLACRHEHSDIDLLIAADAAAQGDAVAALLQHAPDHLPRIDGEIVFAGDNAVAWREWSAWRSGAVGHVLVKRLHGATLEDPGNWTAAA